MFENTLGLWARLRSTEEGERSMENLSVGPGRLWWKNPMSTIGICGVGGCTNVEEFFTARVSTERASCHKWLCVWIVLRMRLSIINTAC